MRPAHRIPRLILFVFVGGALGTGLREGLSLALPTAAGGFPWTTFGINLVGAFVLGVLLETLANRGLDEGRRRDVRLFVGTGVLGGFTTYSSLATSTALLLGGSAAEVGVVYALVSVVLGFAAALLGVTLAARRRHSTAASASTSPSTAASASTSPSASASAPTSPSPSTSASPPLPADPDSGDES